MAIDYLRRLHSVVPNPLITPAALIHTVITTSFSEERLHATDREIRQFVVYRFPYVGEICQTMFCSLTNVKVDTIHARLAEMKQGHAMPPRHKGIGASRSKMFDEGGAEAVRLFFTSAAARFGEAIPSVHVRTDWKDIVLLPTSFTYGVIYRLYQLYISKLNLQRVRDGELTFPIYSRTQLVRISLDATACLT